MKLHEYLLGFLIFSAVILAGLGVIVDVNSNYGTNISTDEYEDFDTRDDLQNLSGVMYNHTLEGDISVDDSWESMTKGAYSGSRAVKQTPKTFVRIIEGIATYLKIPYYLVVIAISATIISIIFAIVYLIMRFKP